MGTPWVSISGIIFQTNHLADSQFFKILKTKGIIFKIYKTFGLGFLWSFGRHKPEAGGFCLPEGNYTRGVKRELVMLEFAAGPKSEIGESVVGFAASSKPNGNPRQT